MCNGERQVTRYKSSILSVNRVVEACLRKMSSPIMLYHAVDANPPDDIRQCLHNVTPDIFRQQVKWLKKNFDIISVDEWFLSRDRNGKACITFDDAYLSVFQNAIPILIDSKIPATVFVNGSTLNGQPLWRDKIRFLINRDHVESFLEYCSKYNRMTINGHDFYRATKQYDISSIQLDRALDDFFQVKGLSNDVLKLAKHIASPEQLKNDPLITYGNHGYHHYVLSTLSEQEQENEIILNIKLIEELSLNKSNIFAFPFGGTNDINDQTMDILKKHGYAGVVYSRGRLNGVASDGSGYIPQAERIMAPNALDGYDRYYVRLLVKQLIASFRNQ